MYGALYVVEDLDEYLADPESYLAGHPLPVADELLKFNRPRKEWKLEDFAGAVEPLEPGRSFANGKQIFQVANCVACHQMNGVGVQVGPDLTKLDPKTKPIDLLTSMLEPSAKIEDKYRTYSFETKDGKVITGMILEETPTLVKVIENPLVKAQPVELKPADIAERAKSDTSIMPKGLLDKLTRDEILDLIAYLAARGDAKSEVFKAGDGHQHQH
jgi:putative heme-binding domain-containing protein